jgi:XTP/dITP diphosphohydrolase
VEGEIIQNKRGGSGFGYDPIFQPKGLKETFAEMNLEDKNKISHRGRAVQGLIQYLQTL